MKTKTTAVAALAALAVPAAAAAERPSHAGHKGQEKAAEKRAEKGKRAKGKGFVVKGIGASDVPVAGGELTGQLTLDPTSANRHARRALDLDKQTLRGTDTVTFGESGDAVVVAYEGLAEGDALQSTDVVKVIGKVGRDGQIDIRKIKVVREAAETETETETESTPEQD